MSTGPRARGALWMNFWDFCRFYVEHPTSELMAQSLGLIPIDVPLWAWQPGPYRYRDIDPSISLPTWSIPILEWSSQSKLSQNSPHQSQEKASRSQLSYECAQVYRLMVSYCDSNMKVAVRVAKTSSSSRLKTGLELCCPGHGSAHLLNRFVRL